MCCLIDPEQWRRLNTSTRFRKTAHADSESLKRKNKEQPKPTGSQRCLKRVKHSVGAWGKKLNELVPFNQRGGFIINVNQLNRVFCREGLSWVNSCESVGLDRVGHVGIQIDRQRVRGHCYLVKTQWSPRLKIAMMSSFLVHACHQMGMAWKYRDCFDGRWDFCNS